MAAVLLFKGMMPDPALHRTLMSQEPNDGQAYLEMQRKALRESVEFWVSEKKPERETWVVRTFLQHLDIKHAEAEVVAEPSEPPDVNFRDARFEIKEILDLDRRRHEEYRKKLEKAMAATSLRELGEQYTPQDLTYQEIGDRLIQVLEHASRHYAPKAIAHLDLLVYVNLIRRVVDAESPLPESSAFSRYAWRSISVVRSSFACVLYARSDAPLFFGRMLVSIFRDRASSSNATSNSRMQPTCSRAAARG